MNSNEIKQILRAYDMQAPPVHIDATAAVVTGLLKGTAERFAKLPLEAEPSGYPAELRRNAP